MHWFRESDARIVQKWDSNTGLRNKTQLSVLKVKVIWWVSSTSSPSGTPDYLCFLHWGLQQLSLGKSIYPILASRAVFEEQVLNFLVPWESALCVCMYAWSTHRMEFLVQGVQWCITCFITLLKTHTKHTQLWLHFVDLLMETSCSFYIVDPTSSMKLPIYASSFPYLS